MQPILLKTKKFFDHRGYFSETYRKDIFFNETNLNINFVQDNFSFSKKNVIRGLHYQWDKPMDKFIRVIQGKILDVIVDIRKDSNEYGKVFYFELSEENAMQLLVPAGFAHGFSVLSETASVQYKCSEFYNIDGESGINPLDIDLKIDWKINFDDLIISEKDKNSKSFKEYKTNPKF